MRVRFQRSLALSSIPTLMLVGCSSDDANQPAPGTGGAGGSGGDAGLSEGSAGLQPFTPPPPDPGPGSIMISASGEVLALTGYSFPPAAAGDPSFVDGWAIHFEHMLVTV